MNLKKGDAVIYKEKKEFFLRSLKKCVAITNISQGRPGYQHVQISDVAPCEPETFYLIEKRDIYYKHNDKNEYVIVKFFQNNMGHGIAKAYRGYNASCEIGTIKLSQIKGCIDSRLLELFDVPFSETKSRENQRIQSEKNDTLLKLEAEKAAALGCIVKYNKSLKYGIDSRDYKEEFLKFFDMGEDEYNDITSRIIGRMWIVFRNAIAYESVLDTLNIDSIDKFARDSSSRLTKEK